MSAKKDSLRILKEGETKRRIYESALELFKEKGFGASVDSIVEMAGVSKGAFYLYYESKFSLILDYVNTLDTDYADYFSSLPSDTKPSVVIILVTERITNVIINNIGFDLIKLIYEAQIKKNINTHCQLSYNRKLYQIFHQIIELGVQQGEFKANLNIDAVSKHFIMSIRGMTYEWCIRFPDFDLKNEIIGHFELLLSGIKNS